MNAASTAVSLKVDPNRVVVLTDLAVYYWSESVRELSTVEGTVKSAAWCHALAVQIPAPSALEKAR